MQVVYSKVARSTVVGLLREHLQRNIVRIGKQWHYQSKGIPQVCSHASSYPTIVFIIKEEERVLYPKIWCVALFRDLQRPLIDHSQQAGRLPGRLRGQRGQMWPGIHLKAVLQTSFLALAPCQACLMLCLLLHRCQVISHVSNPCYWQQQPSSKESCITGQCI